MEGKRKKYVMKAVVSFAIAFVILIGNIAVSDYLQVKAATADYYPVFTIECSKTKVDVGDTITVKVTFDADGGIYSDVMVRLAYDSKAMKLTSYTNGDVYTASNLAFRSENIGVYWDSNEHRADNVPNVTKGGTLFTATFTVLKPDCKFYFNGYACNPADITKTADFSMNTVTTSCAHSNSTDTITQQPTCTADGIKETRCNSCNTVLGTSSVPATGHTAGEWGIIKEAACEEAGVKEKRCIYCNELIETETISATGHTAGQWTVVKEATCKEAGSKELACDVCGEIIDTETIPVLEHSFGEWTVSAQATVDAEGTEERVCSICGEKETRAIPKLEQPTEAESTEEPAKEATVTNESTTQEQPTEEPGTEEPTKESNNTSVKTGDNASLYLVMGVFLISLAGLGTLLAVKRKKAE